MLFKFTRIRKCEPGSITDHASLHVSACQVAILGRIRWKNVRDGEDVAD